MINNKTENISRSNFATGYRVRNQKHFIFIVFFFLILFICLKLSIAKGLDDNANKTNLCFWRENVPQIELVAYPSP